MPTMMAPALCLLASSIAAARSAFERRTVEFGRHCFERSSVSQSSGAAETVAHVKDGSNPGEPGKHVAKQLSALAYQVINEGAEPCNVAFRTAMLPTPRRGSPMATMTTGMVLVAFLAANAAGMPRVVIRSTF